MKINPSLMNLLKKLKKLAQTEPPQTTPEQRKRCHPRLDELVAEGWMQPVITNTGDWLEIDGVQYYEFGRNAEKLTYSRNLAYESAVNEYNEIAGHSQLLRYHVQASRDLARQIFNYRNTDFAQSELAMQQLIGLGDATAKAIETKHPIGFICNVAAIYFVAENEDPEINDPTLQEEKAAKFLKATQFHDFFFRMRLVPLNVLQTLFEQDLLLSTAQAYAQIAGTAKLMYHSIDSQSTDEAQRGTYRRLMAMSIDIINSYEHLFTRLSNSLTTSEQKPSEEQKAKEEESKPSEEAQGSRRREAENGN